NWDNFTITELDGGLRAYAWSYDSSTIQPADIAGCEIRYVTGHVADDTPDIGEMDPLGGGLFADTFESALPVAGDWTFAYRARTTAGVVSDVAYLEVTLAENLGEVLAGSDAAEALARADKALEAANSVLGAPAWDS